MLLIFFLSCFTLVSIFGYSLIVKYYYQEYKSFIVIRNIDFFYGFVFIIFLSIFLNFFFPLKYFTLPIIFIGIAVYLFGLKNKNYDINFIFYFIIIFFITFISYYGKNNVDSPMYHLQIVKWLSLYKINFGIGNLEVRLGNNSSWHSFVGLMSFAYEKFSMKHYLSSILLSFTLYEALRFKKEYKLSDLFIYIVVCYLFFYSYLHPFKYGVILNHLGNAERDLASMFLYFSTIYLFLKIFEESKYEKNKFNLINLFLISVFICITTRITTVPVLLLAFYVLYKNKNYKIFNYGNIFIFFTGLFWMLRSFILSGCLVFPIKQTCLQTTWSTNPNIIENYVTEAMRYSRTLPNLDRVGDLQFTLNSYDWFVPWFKNYFLETAIFQINLIIIISIIILISLNFLFKKLKSSFFKINKFENIIFLTFTFHFLFWMMAPEVRYAWGLHIAIPSFFMAIYFKNNLFTLIKKLNHRILLINFSIIFLLFFSISLSFFKIKDFIHTPSRQFDFSKIEKIGVFNEIEIYFMKMTMFNDGTCADFEKVCVYNKNKNFSVIKKLSYTFFLNN